MQQYASSGAGNPGSAAGPREAAKRVGRKRCRKRRQVADQVEAAGTSRNQALVPGRRTQ